MQVIEKEITQHEVDEEVQALVEGICKAGQPPDRGVCVAGMGTKFLEDKGTCRIGLIEYAEDARELIENLVVVPDELMLMTNIFQKTCLNEPADDKGDENRSIGIIGNAQVDRK